MTKKKINIDDLFKEKLAQSESAFKPEYWSAFEKMLTNQAVNSGLTSAASKILGLAKWKFVSLLSVISVVVTVGIVVLTKNNNDVVDTDSNSGNNLSQSEVIDFDSTKYVNNSSLETEITEKKNNLDIQNQPHHAYMPYKVEKEVHKTKPTETSEPEKINNTISEPIAPKLNLVTEQSGQPDLSFSQKSKTDSLVVDKTMEDSVDFKIPDSSLTKTEEQLLRIKYNRLSIRTGGIVMNTFINDLSSKSTFSISPSIGLGYQWNYNDKFSFSLNADYLKSTKNSLSRHSVSYNYLFFKEKDSIFLKTTDISFVNLNLDLQRHFGDKHVVTLGVYLASRLNTSSSKTRVLINPFYYNSTSSIEKGYIEGLSLLNYGFGMGYQYRIFTNIYSGIRFNITFNDFTDDNLFSAAKHENINQFSFFLKWMIY